MVRQRFPVLPDSYMCEAQVKVKTAPDLGSIEAYYDVFVFDAFGVLNIGEIAIPSAIDRIQWLRTLGKKLFVLTNAASYSFPEIDYKFKRLGFEFRKTEIISSRAVCETYIENFECNQWGVIAPSAFQATDLPVHSHILEDSVLDYDKADAFLFLSAECWNCDRQEKLIKSLQRSKRPIFVANPDLVAPREIGLTVEPGYYAHDLMDRVEGLDIHFHGKPFPSVYDYIERQLGPCSPRDRIVMVGDSLHTDIWGAEVRGWGSVLVTDHGFLKGQDPMTAIQKSGVYPSWIVPSI